MRTAAAVVSILAGVSAQTPQDAADLSWLPRQWTENLRYDQQNLNGYHDSWKTPIKKCQMPELSLLANRMAYVDVLARFPNQIFTCNDPYSSRTDEACRFGTGRCPDSACEEGYFDARCENLPQERRDILARNPMAEALVCGVSRSVDGNEVVVPDNSTNQTTITVDGQTVTFTPGLAKAEAPAGYVSPAGRTCLVPCYLRGMDCKAPRLNRPRFCVSGHFCPEPITSRTCPSDHYCLEGSDEAKECWATSDCPEGTGKAEYGWLCYFILVIIVIVCAGSREGLRRYQAMKRKKEAEHAMQKRGLARQQTAVGNLFRRRSQETVGKRPMRKKRAPTPPSSDSEDSFTPDAAQELVDMTKSESAATSNNQPSRQTSESADVDNKATTPATTTTVKPRVVKFQVGDNDDDKDNNDNNDTDAANDTSGYELDDVMDYELDDDHEDGVDRWASDVSGVRHMMDDIDHEVLATMKNMRTTPGWLTDMMTPMRIDFHDLGLKLKKKIDGKHKTVLQGVSGSLYPGKVAAVMGPSGAGKSSFLSVLSGKAESYGICTGRVEINGHDMPLTSVRDVVGFVPQEDIMLRVMTVKETLTFYAKLRLPRDGPADLPTRVSKHVINALGLDHVQHAPIGDEVTRGVSGGQRKRVNLGIELVAMPCVMLLDEPTSGLDSAASKDVLKILRNVADRMEMTIAAVLHQPSAELFEMFDQVILLARGGRTVYQGPTPEAKKHFFDNGYPCPPLVNPADYYMDVIAAQHNRKEGDTDLVVAWETHESEKNLQSSSQREDGLTDEAFEHDVMDRKKRLMPLFHNQVWMFLTRAASQRLKGMTTLLLDIALLVVGAAIIGIMFSDSQINQIPLVNAMLGMIIGGACGITSLRTFGNEKVVYWRECSMGTTRAAYFLGKNISDLPYLIFAPAIFLLFFWPLASPFGNLGFTYLVILMCMWSFSGVAYIISLLVSPADGQLIIVVLALLHTIFSGANPTIPQMDKMGDLVVGIYHAAYSRWLNEMLFMDAVSDASEATCLIIMPMMDGLGYKWDNHDTGLMALFYIGLGSRVVALVLLLFRHRSRQI